MRCGSTLLILALTMVGMLSGAKYPGDGGPSPARGRVIGIGGVFFKAANPKGLTEWYGKHLGFHIDPRIGVTFPWTSPAEPRQTFRTTWALFPKDTRYFDPSKSELMINYIVDDLDAILERLRKEGVKVDPNIQTDEAGRFGWVFDSEGNKLELWEPARPAN